jgi:thiamine-monophosphate kinase
VVGGNLSEGEALSVSITVLGEADRPVLRSGARVGDEVWLMGDVGAAAAGLRLIRSGSPRSRRAAALYCTKAWRSPRAALREGARVARVATAMIDLSDGLAGDAGQLASASKKRLVIDAEALSLALPRPLVDLCEHRGWDSLELALSGGEDYALLATGAAAQRPRGVRVIGWVERGRGVRVERRDGSLLTPTSSYDHFAGS